MKNLVKVLAVVDGDVVVVKQFRPKLNATTIELPGGNIHVGESPIESAIRELREETGLISDHLIDLGSYTTSDDSIKVSLFFANTFSDRGQQTLDADEDIEVQYHPLHTVLKNVKTGVWRDLRLGIALSIAMSKGLIDATVS